MIRNYEPRHIVLAIAISMFVLAPVVLLVLPTAVIKTLYHSPLQLVIYVTSASYLVYGAGLLFFCLSVLVIFLLWGKKSAVFVSLICLILSGSSFYIAAQHYISVGTDGLAYQFLFTSEEYSYQWNEVEKAVYYYDEDEKVPAMYEFTFQDGESVELVENDHLAEYKFIIHNNLLKGEKAEIEERLYE